MSKNVALHLVRALCCHSTWQGSKWQQETGRQPSLSSYQEPTPEVIHPQPGNSINPSMRVRPPQPDHLLNVPPSRSPQWQLTLNMNFGGVLHITEWGETALERGRVLCTHPSPTAI
jgi:hypothetical protein